MCCAANPCNSLLVLVDRRKVEPTLINSLRWLVDDCGEAMVGAHMAAVNDALKGTATSVASGGAAFASTADALRTTLKSMPLPTIKHIVVCILIPTSWFGVRDAYPSLFLNGWDFTYLDSHSEAAGSVSAASWMRVSMNLQPGFTDTCARSLKGLNTHVMKTVSLSLSGLRGLAHFSGTLTPEQAEFVVAEPFYFSVKSKLATVADRCVYFMLVVVL